MKHLLVPNKVKALTLTLLLLAACTTVPKAPPLTAEPPIKENPPKFEQAPKLTPGFTLEDVSDLPAIMKLIDSLPSKATVRVVLQGYKTKKGDWAWTPMADCVPAFKAISAKANVVIEIVDSDFDKHCDTACYASRAKEAAALFKGAIIEGINEANGTGWLSSSTHEHFIAAAKATKEAGAPLMLTLYSENPETYRAWVEKLPADIRAMVDYVGLSMYPKDNEGHVTDINAFVAFIALKFPNAWIGYGEWEGTDCWTRTVNHPKWTRWCGEWYGSQRAKDAKYATALKASL